MTDLEGWLFRHSAGFFRDSAGFSVILPAFSVILNEGCRSEESLTTGATSITQSSRSGREGAGG
jgi:hypothetical protein